MRYHNEVRAVLKSKRGLGNDKTAQQFADGHRIYHNFCGPHTGLPNGITPAQAAGIDLNLGHNKVSMITRKFHLIAAKKGLFDNCNNGSIDRAS
jgi:hypothetical protein